MSALNADRATPNREGRELSLPVAAGVKIYAGANVAVITSGTGAGFARNGIAASTLKGVGVAIEQADNTAGAAGDIRVKVSRGRWLMANSASADQLTLADIGNDCYLVDDQTVAKTNGSNARGVAGKVDGVETGGVWVNF